MSVIETDRQTVFQNGCNLIDLIDSERERERERGRDKVLMKSLKFSTLTKV